MDGLLNANPLARNALQVFEPIARKSINVPGGLAIDLVYGFAMAGIFLLLARSLPGEPWQRGLVFGLIAWFFRVVMQASSQWMMFDVPPGALLYSLAGWTGRNARTRPALRADAAAFDMNADSRHFLVSSLAARPLRKRAIYRYAASSGSSLPSRAMPERRVFIFAALLFAGAGDDAGEVRRREPGCPAESANTAQQAAEQLAGRR